MGTAKRMGYWFSSIAVSSYIMMVSVPGMSGRIAESLVFTFVIALPIIAAVLHSQNERAIAALKQTLQEFEVDKDTATSFTEAFSRLITDAPAPRGFGR